MSSVSPEELGTIKKCVSKVAKGRTIIAACIYGSRAAGYARPDSDIDVLIVLENYPYLVKYVYTTEQGMEISALIVDRKSLERDAQGAFLGEFVAGRLLHVYESIVGSEFLLRVERVYKRRVILEEAQGIVDSANILSTEILFPLEYLAFSKIKRRMLLYPSATYSYFRTYTAGRHNLEFALDGYKRALEDIVAEDSELFARQNDLLQISEKRVLVDKGTTRLKLSKRLKEFSSYFIQTYAGHRIWHLAVKEAESKIRRHRKQPVNLPDFMSCPKGAYWKLPEGRLIVDSRDWLGDLAGSLGLSNYSIATKRRLGDINSRTVLYVLKDDLGAHKIAVKELAKSKAVKWAALSLWTAPVKRFKVDPMFRLGSEYKAIRYLRGLGLHTPEIEAIVLDRKLLVTRYIEGKTLADLIKGYGKDNSRWLAQAGSQMAKIHKDGSSLGNIKPKNVIVSGSTMFFTDVEQFGFQAGDQAWDVAQFVSWGLKGIRNSQVATAVTREFLESYVQVAGNSNVARLSKSRHYVESFYPILAPSVARAIKNEIRKVAG